MKMDFPKVFHTIRMSDYAEEFGDAQIRVHVNVPRTVIEQELKTDEALFAWLELLWNDPLQGADAAWPVADIRAMWEHCKVNDPALWVWIVDRTIECLTDYRAGVKKA